MVIMNDKCRNKNFDKIHLINELYYRMNELIRELTVELNDGNFKLNI